TQVGKMKAGQKAELKIDAFPGKTFEGKVESLSGGTGSSFSLLPADNASGNFVKVVQRVPVRIAWVNVPTDLALRSGMSVDVTVPVRDSRMRASLLVAFTLLSQTALAEPRHLPVEEAVRLALQSNPRLQSAQAHLRAGADVAKSVGARMLPSVHL